MEWRYCATIEVISMPIRLSFVQYIFLDNRAAEISSISDSGEVVISSNSDESEKGSPVMISSDSNDSVTTEIPVISSDSEEQEYVASPYPFQYVSFPHRHKYTDTYTNK